MANRVFVSRPEEETLDDPEQLEFMETDHGVQDSSEHNKLPPMEQNSAPKPEQCSEGVTGPYSTTRGDLVLSNNSTAYFSLFNRNNITTYLDKNCSMVKKYEVREPIGYGLLMGCEGPGKSYGLPSLFQGVGRDVDHMKKALNENGKWTTITIKNQLLNKKVLCEQLEVLKRSDSILCKVSIFLLFYSGHGNRNGIILDDNVTFSYSDIVKHVASINALKDKPKIFIFDCCRVSSQNQRPFHQDLQQVFCDKQMNNPHGFPPAHTLICHSAADYCRSHLLDEQGSFYTLALVHAIKQFGKRLSFIEIVTQVNGYTREVVKQCTREMAPRFVERNHLQQPIFKSNLDKHLVLKVTSHEDDEAEADVIMGYVPFAVEESRLQMGAAEPVYKGPGTKGHPREGQRDGIHPLRKVEVKSEWKSKDDVQANLRSLGDGISIFFIYAPNPDDPYKKVSNQDPIEQRNRYLMCRLFFDLERHGFHVLSDLHMGDTEPTNWLQWYTTRILHCNFVIFVCSPAFKELFQDTPCVDKIVNDKARRLLEYSNAFYSGISRELSRAGERRKFLPVILDDYEVYECVPALLECGKVYRISHEDLQRNFDYDNRSRDFEKLVCYLAGIDRTKLDQPAIGEVKYLGDPFHIRHMELMMTNEKKRRLIERPPGYLTADELRPPSNLVGQPPLAYSGSSVERASMPVNNAGILTLHQEASIGLSPFIPQPQPQAPTRTSELEDPSTLPLKLPSRKIYLWLSTEILLWKFIARQLGLQESDIERIQTDHRGLDEHRYQMFLTWEQRCYTECNYQRLGEVLMNSEKNRRLYGEFVSKVNEYEQIR